MHKDAIDEIGTALTNLREAFKKYHLPVPDQLSFSDPVQELKAKQAFYFLAYKFDPVSFCVSPPPADTDTELVGFKILWT